MNIFEISDTTSFGITSLLDIIIILGALGVVFLRKIIYSALLLGLVFICVALWYIILNADFLAAAQVLIYVGAINVLIVFAIMLVNKPNMQTNKEWTTGDIIGGTLFFCLFAFLSNMIITTRWENISALPIPVIPLGENITKMNEFSFNSIDIIGIHILTDLLLPFELLSILLLVGLAGAITIARRENFSVTYKHNAQIDIRKR
jgi:NAD(P)H-quinone oxidoreductase subunit 6